MDQAVRLEPDYIITGVTDPARSGQLKSQAVHSGFHGEFILLRDLYEQFDIRSATLKQLAKRLHCQKIPGHIAELGVYKGDTAWKLTRCFLTEGCICLIPLRDLIRGILRRRKPLDVPGQERVNFRIQVKQPY